MCREFSIRRPVSPVCDKSLTGIDKLESQMWCVCVMDSGINDLGCMCVLVNVFRDNDMMIRAVKEFLILGFLDALMIV